MGISFEKRNFSVNYYWKNGEREKKEKKKKKRVSILRDWTRAVCTAVKDHTAWLFANSSLMSNVQYHNDDIFVVKLKLTEKTVEKS